MTVKWLPEIFPGRLWSCRALKHIVLPLSAPLKTQHICELFPEFNKLPSNSMWTWAWKSKNGGLSTELGVANVPPAQRSRVQFNLQVWDQKPPFNKANKKRKPKPQGSPSRDVIAEPQSLAGKAESHPDSPRYKCLQLIWSSSAGLDICKVSCLPWLMTLSIKPVLVMTWQSSSVPMC